MIVEYQAFAPFDTIWRKSVKLRRCSKLEFNFARESKLSWLKVANSQNL